MITLPRIRWLCYTRGMPTFRYEISLGRKSGAVICGVDEAGRGPLAGPVVACAAILPLAGISTRLLGALDDSKRLSAEVREAVATKLRVKAIWALGEASVEEIDRFNILRATFMAMRRAFESLPVQPEQALIDGNMKPGLPCAETTIVEGDHLSLLDRRRLDSRESRARQDDEGAAPASTQDMVGSTMPATARRSIGRRSRPMA